MITRWDISAPYHGEIYEDESEQGDWVKHKDHLAAVEYLEYEIRALGEEITSLENQWDEAVHNTAYWKDLYNELYEQQLL